MKTILIVIILGVAGYFGWQAIQTKPDANVPQAVVEIPATETQKSSDVSKEIPYGDDAITDNKINNSLVAVSFRGFGPGKIHNGSFSNIKSNLYLGASGVMSGDITIDMNSFTTDNEKLTTHLKSKDFFDIEKYPTAKFTLTKFVEPKQTATGVLTIHGITKTVTFPVKKTVSEISSTFIVNMKDFGVNQAFANETIELSVVVPLK